MGGLGHHRAKGMAFLPPVAALFANQGFRLTTIEKHKARTPAIRQWQLMQEVLCTGLTHVWIAIKTEHTHVLLPDLGAEATDQILISNDAIEIDRDMWDTHRLVDPSDAQMEVRQ